MLSGIIAIPVGCFVAGIIVGITIDELVINLIPLIVLATILEVGLMKISNLCVKIFRLLTIGIRIFIIFGIVVGIIRFVTGFELLPYTAPIEDGAIIVFNAAVVMSGTFPLFHIITRLFRKLFTTLGGKLGMNETSMMGFLATMMTNVTTFSMMKNMDERGVILNSAFAVSGAFVFAGHLAFTMSFEESFVPSMVIGKLVAGVFGVGIAYVASKNNS